MDVVSSVCLPFFNELYYSEMDTCLLWCKREYTFIGKIYYLSLETLKPKRERYLGKRESEIGFK